MLSNKKPTMDEVAEEITGGFSENRPPRFQREIEEAERRREKREKDQSHEEE